MNGIGNLKCDEIKIRTADEVTKKRKKISDQSTVIYFTIDKFARLLAGSVALRLLSEALLIGAIVFST